MPTTIYTGITSSLSDAEKQEIYILGSNNPFRYRGYYYDTETGFYYLNGRYYDPQVSRFINSDTTNILTATPMGLTDKNLFAYCDNNPVVRVDINGHFWKAIWDWVVDTYERTMAFQQQIQELDTQIRLEQINAISDGVKTAWNVTADSIVKGTKALWDAYVLNIELEMRRQYQQHMEIINQMEDIFRSPARAGDFTSMAAGNVLAYVGYVSFVANPTVGAGTVLIIGAITAVWTTLRYYEIVSE